MKVGTDAIVLGSWVAQLDLAPRHVLDIGTGTGILTLMLAQIYPNAHFTGIDIDPSSIMDAQYNVQQSLYAERIEIICQDFLLMEQPHAPFDLVISNPPYYEASSIASGVQARRRARHESPDGLELHELLRYARDLMAEDGTLCIIVPHERLHDIRRIATESLLYIARLCRVHSTPNTPIRYLIALRKVRLADPYISCHHEEITLRTADGAPSPCYQSLTSLYLRHQ